MTFISYAQNFEDVMLWRALRHIQNGCYIDIGANDPIVDSVSLAFYEHGWRGVHLEPTAQYANLLRQQRPDELVIQAAVSDSQKLLTFFEFPDTGLSTLDAAIAAEHQQKGFRVLQTVTPTLTLDDIFAQIPAPDIHWLKIDVEGAETSVLQGWQTSEVRPWIVVIESTLPMSQTPSYQQWESLLLAKGYQFVYFDGLNRYYVSDQHPELMAQSWLPPNVFDGFTIDGRASNVLSQDFQRRLQAAVENGQQSAAATLQDHEQAKQTLLNQLAQTRAQLELEATSAREEYQALSSQVRDARDELGQMVRLVSQREQEFANRFEHFQTDYQAVNQLLQQERDQASTQLQALQQQLQTQQQQYQAELQRHSELEGKLSALQLQLRQKEQAFAGQLLQLHQQKSGQQKVFQIREQSLRTELQRAREEIQRVGAQYQAELQDLRQTHETLRTESASWQQQYLQLQQENAEQIAQLAAALQQSENGAALQLQQHATELHQIIAELNSARDYIEQHQQQITQLSTERDQLRNELSRVAKGYVELRADFKEKARRTTKFIQALQARHQFSAQQAASERQLLTAEAEQQISELTSQLQQTHESVHVLQHLSAEKLEKAEGIIEQLSSNLESSKSSIQFLEERYSELNLENKKIANNYGSALTEIEELKEKNRLIEAQLNNVIKECRDEITALRAAVTYYYQLILKINIKSPFSLFLNVFRKPVKNEINQVHDIYFRAITKDDLEKSKKIEALTMNGNHLERSKSINEIFRYSGYFFVVNAFLTLLNRLPDDEGLNVYLTQLQIGVSKEDILYQIVQSKEWKNKSIFVSGLKPLIRKVSWQRRPVIGRLASYIFNWSGAHIQEKQLRNLEVQISNLVRSFDDRFAILESKFDTTMHQLNEQSLLMNRVVNRIDALEVSKICGYEAAPEGRLQTKSINSNLVNLSPRANIFFSMLSDIESKGVVL